MHFHLKHLRCGDVMTRTVVDDGSFTAVYGEGGGCTLEVAGGAAGVWIPLHGSLQVHSSGLNRSVHGGEVLITEIDHITKAIGHTDGRWLAVVGGKRVWAWALTDTSGPGAQLFPDLHRADHDLRRAAIAVARASAPLEQEGMVNALADRVVSLQAPLHRMLARCPGRTLARKRHVFLRLQRVRYYISAFCNQDLDNEMLALMANFSPCYFLRTFKAVYQETPHSYLIKQRLQRARRLLHSSNLAITEVALASGFENRCVFSRTFRQHFGITALEARLSVNAFAIAG